MQSITKANSPHVAVRSGNKTTTVRVIVRPGMGLHILGPGSHARRANVVIGWAE